MKQSLNDIADAVIQKLSGKVIIHRYDAYSTNSIYLKFDYGVANSLRISDHDGKRHLRYRYNILESMGKKQNKEIRTRHGLEMVFYSPAMINACCRDILAAKKERVERYRDYDAIVEQAKERAALPQKGFWSGARLVSGRRSENEAI